MSQGVRSMRTMSVRTCDFLTDIIINETQNEVRCEIKRTWRVVRRIRLHLLEICVSVMEP